jgi:hypothetical protein
MEHTRHEPGTVADCERCRLESYEPGWYRMLREQRAAGETPAVPIPPAEQGNLLELEEMEELALAVYLPELG